MTAMTTINSMKRTGAPLLLLLLLAILATSLAFAAACEKSGGEFGEGQKVKDDGSVRRIEAPPEPPKFDDAVAIEPAFDKAGQKLVVTLKLKPGFHAYAPGEEIGKPVELAVEAPWSVEGAVEMPAGKKKDLGELGTSVILEGDVPLTAVVKGGEGELKGTVTAQVCTDKACDRPRKHPFTIPAT
jgi:DsbC/DsbD-like thiol-disulfide interchange protein